MGKINGALDLSKVQVESFLVKFKVDTEMVDHPNNFCKIVKQKPTRERSSHVSSV